MQRMDVQRRVDMLKQVCKALEASLAEQTGYSNVSVEAKGRDLYLCFDLAGRRVVFHAFVKLPVRQRSKPEVVMPYGRYSGQLRRDVKALIEQALEETKRHLSRDSATTREAWYHTDKPDVRAYAGS